MKKITLTILLNALFLVQLFGQPFPAPLATNPVFLNGRTIIVGANTLFPVAIATHKGFSPASPEKVAVSWYDAAFNYGSATMVRIYSSLADFENNSPGVDYTGFIGVEALAFDHSIGGNLAVMETENGGGKLRIFNAAMTEVASYTSGDIGTALGAGFYNSRGLVFDNQGNLYIADDGNNRIVKIQNPTNESTAVITEFIALPNGSGPKSVTILNGKMMVACFNTKKIVVFDMLTLNQVTEISTGAFSPLDLTAHQAYGAHFYTSMINQSNFSGKVVAYNENGNVSQQYTDFGGAIPPCGLICNTEGNIYCSDGSNGRFVKYNRTLFSGNDIESFSVDGQTSAAVFDNGLKTITIPVPNGFDMTNVHTHFTTSFLSMATPNSYDYNLMPTDFSTNNTVAYTITAENGTTATWHVFLEEQLGINEQSDPQLVLFPNPVSNILTVSSEGIICETIEIINTLGQREIIRYNESSIDCSTLEKGCYFARINGLFTYKFNKK